MPADPTRPTADTARTLGIAGSAAHDSVEEAVAALRAHPWISSVVPDGVRGVIVMPDPDALAAGPRPGALVTEFLDQWSEVYEATYRAAAGRHADGLDLSGWRATDTGQPLPTGHMRQWLDRTVELVLAVGPRHLLELGCGTGMLLHRLQPHVAGYVGTDVAPHVVATLGADAPRHVRVLTAAAHDLTSGAIRDAMGELRFPYGRPDCVLLNSVTQCFPDVAYLSYVVSAAVEIVAPGGAVVVGDVRHAALHDHFCQWAERAAAADADLVTIAGRAAARAERDEELLLDPAVIARAAARSGRDVRVSVHAKTMREDTELTRYRYDVVLQVDRTESPSDVAEVDWSAWPDGDRWARLRNNLDGPPTRVRGIPNALLRPDAPAAVTGYELRKAVGGRGDVLLDPDRPDLLEVATPGAGARPAADVAAGHARAHEPLPGYVRRRLGGEARRLLRHRLPGAHVPVTVDLSGVTR